MIGKVMTGKSFSGCVRYVLNRKEAVILEAKGIRTETVGTITYDFNMQRKLNPNLGQAVGHLVLSWSIHDGEKLNRDVMVQLAKEYLEKMKITETQYFIVQHQDKQHPHLHIIYNRVNHEGKTITDKFQKQLNAKICKELTLKYGYYLAQSKEQVNRQQLKGTDKIKYELYDAIHKAVSQSKSWQELEEKLSRQQIAIQYKYKRGTDEIQGISFRKYSTAFKGSQIDRSLSYSKINARLSRNVSQKVPLKQPLKTKDTAVENDYQEISHLVKQSSGRTLLDELLQPVKEESSYSFIQQKKKKRKRMHL